MGKNANWDKKNYELQFDSVNIQKRPTRDLQFIHKL